MESIPAELVKNETQSLVNLVENEAQYICCFNSYVQEYEQAKGRLKAKLEDVRRIINQARGVSLVTSVALQWTREAEELIDIDTKKEKCFNDLCLNCWPQYQKGRDLAKRTLDIDRLLKRCNFDIVAGLTDLLGIKYHCLPNFRHFDSRKSIFKELQKALEDEENNMIGLEGLGGTGKTSMATKVSAELEGSTFSKVIFLVVSKLPDLKHLQGEIAGRLDLKSEDGEYHEKILTKIKALKEKLLIVLDDVWMEFDLRKELGIPPPHLHKGCTILITTQSKEICTKMDCQRIIHLQALTDKEALQLFLEHANSSSTSENLAQKIVKHCHGVLVVIVAVARSLKDRPFKVWTEALRNLQSGESIFNVRDEDLKKVYEGLKLSYDNLRNEKAKKLLLISSLFPEDFNIPMEFLIRIGVGMGPFGKEVDDYNKRKRKALDAVVELLACPKPEELVFWSNDYVKQEEDTISQKPGSLTHLISEATFRQLARTVELLSLSGYGKQKNLIPDIVPVDDTGMTDLIILQLDSWPDMQCLIDGVNNRFDVNNAFSNLVGLYLSEMGLSNILFNGHYNLSHLKTLKLKECRKLTSIFLPSTAQSLLQLEELNIERCDALECIVEDQSSRGEIAGGDGDNDQKSYDTLFPKFKILKIDSCDNLEIILPILHGGWPLERISIRWCKKLKYIFDKFQEVNLMLPSLERMGLFGLPSLVGFFREYEKSIFSSLQQPAPMPPSTKTRSFSWAQVCCFKSKATSEEAVDAVSTERLLDAVLNCFDVKNAFSNLVGLYLSKMELSNILFNGHYNLSHLKTLNLDECPNLTSIFLPSTAQGLLQLEELNIEGCDALECIVEDKSSSGEIAGGDGDNDQKRYDTLFPKFKILEIYSCDNLEIILPILHGGWPLERISIRWCKKLKYIFDKFQEVNLMLPSLERMELFGLPSLVGFFREYEKSISSLQQPAPMPPSTKTRSFSWAQVCCFKSKATREEAVDAVSTERLLDEGIPQEAPTHTSPNLNVLPTRDNTYASAKSFEENEEEEEDDLAMPPVTIISSEQASEAILPLSPMSTKASTSSDQTLSSVLSKPSNEATTTQLSDHSQNQDSEVREEAEHNLSPHSNGRQAMEPQQSTIGSLNFTIVELGAKEKKETIMTEPQSRQETIVHDIQSHEKEEEGREEKMPSLLEANNQASTISGVQEIVDMMKLEGFEHLIFAKALETHPQLRLSTKDRSARVLHMSYRVLLDILNILTTRTPFTITEADKRMLAEHLKDAYLLGFDKDWIESIKNKVFYGEICEVDSIQNVLEGLDNDLKSNEAMLKAICHEEVEAARVAQVAQQEHANVMARHAYLLKERQDIIERREQCWEIIAAKYRPFGF
ncbi:probable disease resistance protein At5g43740 [Neltuma alba]|uniref:probable disease resistance protein At5g43740 n=1 Tax=Neltuma alba TaxID=207710 RepID=UPI0010A3DDEC|nr:probable disease resistance protein At5g43740 [Prosopis alba]